MYCLLDEGYVTCGAFDGNWVWDERYPLYESQIALSWMEALDVLRMAGLILSLPSSIGKPKIAACPGILPFCICFPCC